MWRTEQRTDLATDAEAAGSVDDALARITAALSGVPGVAAVALGGSRATGTARPDSDIDVGMYYRHDHRPDFAGILASATELDDASHPDGHGYGAWGPWINGGVWMRVADSPGAEAR